MDREQLRECFPTLYPGCLAVGRVAARISRFPVRVIRRVWKPVFVTCIVLGILHFIAVLVTGAMLSKEIDKLRKYGYPTTFAELIPHPSSPIPDSENAAVIYRRAFAQLSSAKVSHAFEYDVGYDLIGSRDPMTPENWSSALEYVTATSGIAKLAEQAAAMSECRFAVRTEEDTYNVRWGLRKLIDTLMVHAVVHAYQGDLEGSLRAFRAACKGAQPVRAWPNHFSLDSMVAARSYCVLQRISSLARLSEGQLKQIHHALSQVTAREYVSGALLVDHVDVLQGYDEARRYGLLGLFVDYCNNEERPFLRERVCGYLESPFLNANEIVALRDLARNRAYADRPLRELVRMGFTDSVFGSNTIPKWAFVARTWLSVNIAWHARTRDTVRAETRGGMVYVALLAYKNRFGVYPVSLDQLRKHIRWEIPEDPFSGKDFVYRRQGGGFVLYSIGRDLKDDRGEPRRHDGHMDQVDIVWTSPAKR